MQFMGSAGDSLLAGGTEETGNSPDDEEGGEHQQRPKRLKKDQLHLFIAVEVGSSDFLDAFCIGGFVVIQSFAGVDPPTN